MPISLADLIAMREKVESDKRRLHEELDDLDKTLAAISQLENRLRADKRFEQAPLALEAATPQAAHQELPKVSFAESVRRAVRQIREGEFTVSNVENILVAQGIPLPARHLRTRIAMEIKDLVRRNQVALVKKGAGNAPHKYRLLDQPEDEAEKGEGGNAETLPPSVTRITKSRGGIPMLAV